MASPNGRGLKPTSGLLTLGDRLGSNGFPER